MALNLKKTLGKVAKQGPNMQEAQKGGGGDYTPPPEGACMLRFIGYIEGGKQKATYKGETKIRDKVKLVFELHGKNYAPKELDDGTKLPMRITVTETLSLSEKANFYKIFNAMRNGREDITHMAQMLGEPFMGRVYHNEGKEGKVFANLRNDTGYSIRPPYREDPETGEARKLNVPEAISQLRLFVWDMADEEMWESLFIDGEYEEGKTKNVLQEWVLGAVNFEGSPLQALLAGAVTKDDDPDGSGDDDVTDVETPPEATKPKADAKPKATKKPKKSADPLDDVDDDIPY